MNYDIFLVGVGGQGVLTIGDLITEAAIQHGIPANFYPTKGMAQRGGFVKAQLRLGREMVGPQIPEKHADLAIAMELSEALKAVRYVRTGGEFVLLAHVWQPAAVMLGKAPYPALADVQAQIKAAGVKLVTLDPARVPLIDGTQAPLNIYVLAAALGSTQLGKILDPAAVGHMVKTRWKGGAERNQLTFSAGLEAVA